VRLLGSELDVDMELPIVDWLFDEKRPNALTLVVQGPAEKFIIMYDIQSETGDMFINMTEEELKYYFPYQIA
ncbi:MAG: hypothetical protein Q4B65_01615, partial [Candidatus Saccharibacteria bacterium]|nr:hypothetical protein [Candidatus Saccharibacteria bacterium]